MSGFKFSKKINNDQCGNKKSNNGKIFGAAAGILGVLAVAFLFDPKKGKQRRRTLKKQGESLNLKLKETLEDSKNRFSTYLEDKKHDKEMSQKSFSNDEIAEIFEYYDNRG